MILKICSGLAVVFAEDVGTIATETPPGNTVLIVVHSR